MNQLFKEHYQAHLAAFSKLDELAEPIIEAGKFMIESLSAGNKILICGNGGSAGDAQHFAAELVGRFQREREAWAAVALTTDTSILTAVGNDYGYDDVFARQVAALARTGDVLIGISTSGKSENVLRAMQRARLAGARTVGLVGRDGGDIAKAADVAVIVPCHITAHIQEVHIFILHFWCGMLEAQMAV